MRKQGKQVYMPTKVIESIDRILTYNWKDEEHDFQNNAADAHIFNDLKVVNAWMNLYRVCEPNREVQTRPAPTQRVNDLMFHNNWSRERAEAFVERYPRGNS
jgi:hypothetical protein